MKTKKHSVSKSIIIGLLLLVVIAVTYGLPIPYTGNGQSSMSVDLYDPTIRVSESENIFVGEVIAKTGNQNSPTTGYDSPHTQFQVKVKEVLKGNLKDTVQVDQFGGVVKEEGVRYTLLYDNDPILSKGNTYLFFTNEGYIYNLDGKKISKPSEMILYPGLGNIPIESDEQRNTLINEWSAVIENQ